MEIKQQCEQGKVCTRTGCAMRKHYFKSCFGTEELRASSQEVLNLKEISLQFGVHTWLEKVQVKFTGWKSSFAFCVQTTGGAWSLGKLWEGSESQSAEHMPGSIVLTEEPCEKGKAQRQKVCELWRVVAVDR